jgi:hypothetical protein
LKKFIATIILRRRQQRMAEETPPELTKDAVDDGKQKDKDGKKRTQAIESIGVANVSPPAAKRKRGKQKSKWSYFSKEQETKCKEAIAKKYDSLEMYITSKCMKACSQRIATGKDGLFSPSFIEHVISLWHKQQGRCMFTGQTMYWKIEDTRKNKGSTVTLVCLGLARFGFVWCEGNVGLVCSTVKSFVCLCGWDRALFVANEIHRFEKFKQERPNLARAQIFEEWDEECHKSSGSRRWSGMDTLKTIAATKYFSRGATFDIDIKASKPMKKKMAPVCIDLYEEQRGRCALSGLKVSDFEKTAQYTQPSVDRVDCTIPHGPGNLMITTRHVNRGRGNLSIHDFLAIIEEAIKWNQSSI